MFAMPLLALALLGQPAAAPAEGLSAPVSGDVSATATVAVGPLTLKAGDLRATEKPGYVHLMVDLFPYRDAIKAAGDKAKPEVLAKDLVKKFLLPKYPQAAKFKVVLAEFPERDEYDAPRWDKIQVLGRYNVTLKGKALHLAKE